MAEVRRYGALPHFLVVVVGEVVVVVMVVVGGGGGGGGGEASCGLPTPPPTIGSRGGSRILHVGLPVIYACLRAVWKYGSRYRSRHIR